MRCIRYGTEASPKETDEPGGWTAPDSDDEGGRCTERILGAHPRATAVRFAPMRLRQWVHDKVREDRLRRSAKRQGLTLMAARSRESRADGSGRYWLSPVDKDSGSLTSRLWVGAEGGMTLDGVEEYLIYGTTRAEIMEYLNQAYGPAFVEDLIKHLPPLRAEALNLAQLRCRITASTATVN